MASPQACLEDPSAASRIAPGCRAGWTAGTSSGLTRLHCSHGPFRYPFPASRHQPNPQSRRAKGRRTGSPPQPWSCAFDDPDHQRGFTPRRPALDAVIHGHTLRYLLPCSRSRVSLGQDKACDRESEGVRGMTTIIGSRTRSAGAETDLRISKISTACVLRSVWCSSIAIFFRI